MVQTCHLKESFEVVCTWSCLTLEATFNGRDVLLVGVVRFLAIIVVAAGSSCNPPWVPLSPLFAFLSALVGDIRGCRSAGAGDRFPIARDKEAPNASSPGTCWAAMPSCPLVVYLATSFIAQKRYGSHAPRTPLPNAFGPSPLGSRLCPSQLSCPPRCRLYVRRSNCASMSLR
jgi:hypothetical protein